MKTETKNIWSQIKADHTDDEGVTHIDAYITSDDNETGKVIATVDFKGNSTYIDERAKSDKYAQEVIVNAIRENDDKYHELVDKVIENLKKDFRDGDYTVIDELLQHLPIDVLRNSLPE